MNGMKITLSDNEDLNREPTAQELRDVPEMTQEDRASIMRSPEYKSSRLVQKLVAASLLKSDHSRRDSEEVQSMDLIQAKQATITNMMKGNRYKTDPAYRYEVAQKIAALTANDNAEISAGDMGRTNQTVRVGVSASPYHGADLRVSKFTRVALEPTLTTSEAPAKAPKTVKEPFSE